MTIQTSSLTLVKLEMDGEKSHIRLGSELLDLDRHDFQLDDLVEKIKQNDNPLIAIRFQKDSRCRHWK